MITRKCAKSLQMYLRTSPDSTESCTLLAYMLILKIHTRVLKVQLSEFLLFLPGKLQPRSFHKGKLVTVSCDLGSRS